MHRVSRQEMQQTLLRRPLPGEPENGSIPRIHPQIWHRHVLMNPSMFTIQRAKLDHLSRTLPPHEKRDAAIDRALQSAKGRSRHLPQPAGPKRPNELPYIMPARMGTQTQRPERTSNACTQKACETLPEILSDPIVHRIVDTTKLLNKRSLTTKGADQHVNNLRFAIQADTERAQRERATSRLGLQSPETPQESEFAQASQATTNNLAAKFPA